MAYIYQIINDINGKVYIGKTERTIKERFKEHCKDCKRQAKEHRPLYAAMRKYGIEHFHVELLEETDNLEEREKYWIEKLGTFKCGYNATMGGDGKKYLDYDLIIATYQQVQNIRKVSELLHHDEHTIGDILEANNIQIKSQQEVNREEYGRKIAKCDKETGEIIEVFPSIKEAGKSIGKPHNHISSCANNKRKSAYGFIWKFI